MILEISIASFFGRFHPVLVHLPIGILLLAFVFQLLSLDKRFRKLKVAVQPSVLLGMISAIASAGSGYFLSREGGYDEALVTQHKWMGFATVGLTVMTYLFTRKYSFLSKGDRKWAVTILFFPLVILLVWTGHLGGSITHGEGFLLSPVNQLSDDVKARSVPVNIDKAVVFTEIVHPLLEEKCFACHSSKKQKGQLRLDDAEWIRKGGKQGQILAAGDPEQSELFKRISLSVEEKGHMPPRKESQLTSAEIEFLRWWIEEGASFDNPVKNYQRKDELQVYLKTLAQTDNRTSWIPDADVSAADRSTIEQLRRSGVAVVNVSDQSNYLRVNFTGRKQIDKQDLELLVALKDQVVDLDLSWTSIANQDIQEISKLEQLRFLNLGHTSITSDGIAPLKSLQNLFYLNLVDTKVSESAVTSLNAIKSLKELYMYNTNVKAEDLSRLNPEIKVDTGGYQLPALATDTIRFRKK